MALNAKMEEHGGGSRCRMKDRHKEFECQIENAALNAKLKTSTGFESQNKDVALNSKLKISTSFERRNEDIMALNAERK